MAHYRYDGTLVPRPTPVHDGVQITWTYQCEGGRHTLLVMSDEFDGDGNFVFAELIEQVDLGPCCHNPDFKSS
jgi:hypothetical protein